MTLLLVVARHAGHARVLADDDRLVILIICSVYSGRGVMVLICVAVLPHGKCVTHQHINTHWELSGADTADQLMEYLGHQSGPVYHFRPGQVQGQLGPRGERRSPL